MKYLFLGNFTMGGSGYTTIMRNVALGLVERGHEVMILGVKYSKQVHDYPFTIAPLDDWSWSAEALQQIPQAWGADRIILCMDIPKIYSLTTALLQRGDKRLVWKLEAIFPVESHPIEEKWAKALGVLKHRYAISKYGQEQCKTYGIPAHYMPMGCHVGKQPSNKNGPREKLGWPKDKTIFLTVADNHERKMLPLAMEAFSTLPEDAYYVLLTTLNAKSGWNLVELRKRYGIEKRCDLVNGGVSEATLSMMYWAADALVITSQAEGACLPVISEAPAHGLPVICGSWTGLSDVADAPWIIHIGYDYEYTHPWGNVLRWMASVDDVVNAMHAVHFREVDLEYMSHEALEYARAHTWSDAVNVIEQADG